MDRIKRLVLLVLLVFSSQLFALNYPGTAPGKANRYIIDNREVLHNDVIHCQWELDGPRSTSLTVRNEHTGQAVRLPDGFLPKIILDSGLAIDLVPVRPNKSVHMNNSIVAEFKDHASGLAMRWSVTLSDADNAIIQELHLTASRDTKIKEIVFIDAVIKGARQIGQVDGSVVVCGDIFMAVEHPLAKNTVGENLHVRCSLPRGNVLKTGQSWSYTSVIGVTPPGQLRRGFLYYLERRRAHPYRQFLHYNNWYDVILARRVERIRESECLEAIDLYGCQLVEKRKVKMDAFVWDDGWDDFNSLWGFHKGFPDGFKNLNAAANKFGVKQGVWMSPWGGYASVKDKRIAYGKSKGYETNASGYSMAGPKYAKAFGDVCLDMMRNQGVIFFKFDGMGGGNKATGADVELADDIDAVLELTRTLRREKPEVFISATVGTWASPFWTLYADSIWRQGGDNGLYGKGDTRQQWITYRDKFCYERIVQLGPLYPLNSLMLHGILIGDRRSPARIVRNEKSVADEIWSFFGSGTCLQELYVNPKLPTEKMWDELAAAAKWSRANSDVLVDTHWIGGNPAKEQVYGWASWQPGKGIIVLRNPSEKPQNFNITTKAALQLPNGIEDKMTLKAVYPRLRQLTAGPLGSRQPLNLTLQPFEVVVIELRKAR